MTKVAAIIVTYRRPETFPAVLESLGTQTRRPDIIVVVANEPSSDVARATAASVSNGWDARYLPQGENLGPAGGTALGMRVLLDELGDEDWFLRVDDDKPLGDNGVIADLLDLASAPRRDAATIGAVGLVGARFDWRKGELVSVPADELHGAVDVDYLATNFSPLFRCGAVRVAGPFDARLFFGSSEVEFGLRLRAHGFALLAHGDRWAELRPTRLPGGSLLDPPEATWRRYYSVRNQIFLLRSTGHSLVALRVIVLRIIARPLVGLPRAPARSLRALSQGVRAASDGWRGRLGRRVDVTLDEAGNLRPT